MPRRFRSRAPRRRRQTKWCAATFEGDVIRSSSLVPADAIALCQPTVGETQDQADIVLGWMKGSLSLSRSLTNDAQPACAWAIVMQRTDPGGSNLPIQVFDPFNLADLERQDILGMGHMEIPPIILKSDNQAQVDSSSRVTKIDVKVSRKLDRNTNGIFLWVVSTRSAPPGTNVAYTVVGDVRSLMKFG